jgi:uncharacterized DUF497 family protein
MPRWEWDSIKSAWTLQERQFDFAYAVLLFRSPYVLRRVDREGERRWQAIGIIDGRYYSVIYTKRFHPKRRRLISARRARVNEIAEWTNHYA